MPSHNDSSLEPSDHLWLPDLDLLHQRLHETCKEMTRWDVYVSEVESGRLKWGIVHTEKFFMENAKRMEGKEGNFEIVKVRKLGYRPALFSRHAFSLTSAVAIQDLLGLAVGYDEEVAAIACFDIGEFVRHYPNGRAIARRLRARDVVIRLIEHDNPELQHQALQCVSKMLLQNRQVSSKLRNEWKQPSALRLSILTSR
jgi:V-type H+-transporting ATPase subunit H